VALAAWLMTSAGLVSVLYRDLWRRGTAGGGTPA